MTSRKRSQRSPAEFPGAAPDPDPVASREVELVGSAELPRAPVHRPRGTPRPSWRGPVRAAALVGVHVLFLLHLAHWRVGGSTLSPVEPSEAAETLEFGYVNAGFALLVLAVLATLVFGRFFCGWACHVIAYQDLAAWLAGKIGWRPRILRSRALALAPFVAAFLVFGQPLARRLQSAGALPNFVPHFAESDFWATFPGFWIGALTLAVDGFLIVWFLGSKGFCTYGCPYGAFFGVADRVAPTRIRVTDACEGCGHCTATCTSNVRVHEEVARFGAVVDPGCMKCLDCVSVCPKEALYVGRKSAGRAAARLGKTGRRPRRTWDFSWPEEIALALLFLFGLAAYRGLYNEVSLMLALGLAVLFAAGTLALVRLARARDFAVQGRAWKRAGKITTGGGLALAGLGLGIAFTLHSGYVQIEKRRGEWAFERGLAAEGDARSAAFASAAAHFTAAREVGLCGDSAVEERLGHLATAGADWSAAAAHFARALELNPRMHVRLPLAEAELRAGRPAAAERALEELLEREPADTEALTRLAQLYLNVSEPPRWTEAESVLQRLVAASTDDALRAAATEQLSRVRAALGR